VTSAAREAGRAALGVRGAARGTLRAALGDRDAPRSFTCAPFEAASASSLRPAATCAPSWAEFGLASAAPRRPRAALEPFREALSVSREALAQASASRSSGSGDGGASAEARVTRSGALGLECVPRGARRCATTATRAGSIEARAALVIRWAARRIRREALLVRWAALLVRREAPARPREARRPFPEDVATSRDALVALLAAFALRRSAATVGRAMRTVSAARPSRTRSALSSSSGALSPAWADRVATSAALVELCEAQPSSRAALVVPRDAPSVVRASLVTPRASRRESALNLPRQRVATDGVNHLQSAEAIPANPATPQFDLSEFEPRGLGHGRVAAPSQRPTSRPPGQQPTRSESPPDTFGEEAITRRYPQRPDGPDAEAKYLDALVERLGSVDRVPTLAVPQEEIRSLALESRGAFLLSQVDSVSSIEMILDVSGMPREDALCFLVGFVEQGFITFD